MEQEKANALLLQAAQLQQQAEQTEQHLALINNELAEMSEFEKQIDSFSKNQNNEMISSIGKGVYAKASLTDKNFLVNAGAGVLIKKTPEETKKIVKLQIEKLEEAKASLLAQLELFHNELRRLVGEIEKFRAEKNKSA